jgi:hypothetical protein
VTGTYHPLLSSRSDWAALAERDAAIDRAHQAYKSSMELGRNLELTGWTAARREAALRGEAILVDPDQVDQHRPTVRVAEDAGRATLSPWSEFLGLHHQITDDRIALLARLHPQLQQQALEREAEILDAAPDRPLRDLDQAAAELTLLVQTLAASRAAAGILREGTLREQVTPADVYLAAASRAAGDPDYSLLSPVSVPARSVATSTQGLRPDEPKRASSLPPANVVMRG